MSCGAAHAEEVLEAEMENEKRNISIETWHTLSLHGQAPPVKIYLDGGSMRPLIRRKTDKVTILPLDKPLERGDIVLFKSADGRFVVHRVWQFHDDWIQTLGDWCIFPDAPIPRENIYGVVTEMKRGGKYYSLDAPEFRAFGKFWMRLFPLRRTGMIFYKKLKWFLKHDGRIYR